MNKAKFLDRDPDLTYGSSRAYDKNGKGHFSELGKKGGSMSRFIRLLATCALAAVGVAGLIFLSACSSTSSSAGGTGSVRLLVTDAPSDDWQEVTVHVKSVSLRNASDQSWNSVWTADSANPDSGKLNLIDLSGVAQLLASATIPAGTYDRLQLAINTDPTSMTLVDDNGNTIDPANITVVDPSGNGQIKVDISPAIKVPWATRSPTGCLAAYTALTCTG